MGAPRFAGMWLGACLLATAACGGDPGAGRGSPAPPPTAELQVEAVGPNRFAIGAAWWSADGSDVALFGGPPDMALVPASGAPDVAMGEVDGSPELEVGALPRQARAHRLGLRAGDRVRKIRGQRPATAAEAATLLRGVADMPMFTIEVLRQGQPVTLIYEVR